MPEAKTPDIERTRKRAIADYQRGKKPKEISEHYGVSINTVKSWIKRAKDAPAKKGAPKKVQKGAPKRAPGAPAGNTNALGLKGVNGAPVGNTNAMKHGGYSAVYWDTLTEEEKGLLEDTEYDEEQLLLEEIALLSIRERRIMARIRKIESLESGMAVRSIMRSEEKRTFDSEEDRLEYERRQREKVDSGDILPGRAYHLSTATEATYDVVRQLEEALSRCQSQKQKCIQTLADLRKARGDGGANALAKLDDVLAQIKGVDNAIQ